MHRVLITARARDEADAIHAWMAENLSPAFAMVAQGMVVQGN